MNTLVKVGIIIAAIAGVIMVVPAIKGPYNRIKNTANEALESEFVVDNYKAKYVQLYDKKQEVVKNLQKFQIEMKVTEKKLAYANDKMEAAKKTLKETGTADMQQFARAKDAYEATKTEFANFKAMADAYSKAIVKLEDTLRLIDMNMSKAKSNVAALESKKTLVDSISAVNKTVESLNGISGDSIGMNVEKLDDDYIRESIKLDALREDDSSAMSRDDAENYLRNLQ